MLNLFDKITQREKENVIKLLEGESLFCRHNVSILSKTKQDDFLAFVEFGKVQIIRNDYNGTRVIIEEINQNEIFSSIISPLASESIEIVPKEDTEIIIFDYNRIMNSLSLTNQKYFNQFIKNLFVIISEKIHDQNNRIEVLTQRSTRDKLLQYFEMESGKYGSRTFNLPFSFTELADYLAVDRSAMMREIKYLKEDRIIRVNKKTITLTNYY